MVRLRGRHQDRWDGRGHPAPRMLRGVSPEGLDPGCCGGSLTNKTVKEVLAAIQTLAIREENTMVARVTLHNMRQDRDETVRSFGARL